ncbi:MAG: hypothetical protein Tsb0033_22830 [Winogradskyella sp.]
MVRLIKTCFRFTLKSGAPNNAITVADSKTQNQNAGYNLVKREIQKLIRLEFLADIRITNPLIIKNNSTPKYPYLEKLSKG